MKRKRNRSAGLSVAITAIALITFIVLTGGSGTLELAAMAQPAGMGVAAAKTTDMAQGEFLIEAMPLATEASRAAPDIALDTGSDQTKAAIMTQASTDSLQVSPQFSAKSISKALDLNVLASKFKLSTGKYYNTVGYSTNHYKYTSSELKMLAVVIYLEARGQPYKAKVAVANVVMNRVLAAGYPGSTIREVVTRPNQFCYKSSVQPSKDCLQAARDVLEHEVWVVPQNTYFFRATASKSNWGRHAYYAHIGSTAFYRDSKYAGRYNGSTVPSKLYSRTYKWPQYGCTTSARVRKVQLMLSAVGYKTVADGYFGTGTKNALIKFQKSAGLTPDGIAGPATLRALIKKYGVNKYLKL